MEHNGINLEIKNIYKSFGGLQALNGVNLKFDQSEIVGLIGPNGAGKTTLTNVIDGVHKPTRGEVYLNNKRIDPLPPYQIARLGIGRTFQVTRAFRRMTVMENMLVPAMASTGTRKRSSSRSTPMWAAPRAPPPPSTRPMRGRASGAVESSASALVAGRAAHSNEHTTMG